MKYYFQNKSRISFINIKGEKKKRDTKVFEIWPDITVKQLARKYSLVYCYIFIKHKTI